jgi:hypothetical protein
MRDRMIESTKPVVMRFWQSVLTGSDVVLCTLPIVFFLALVCFV